MEIYADTYRLASEGYGEKGGYTGSRDITPKYESLNPKL